MYLPDGACKFPSGEGALALLQGRPGGLVASAWWTAQRAALLAAGIYALGERERVWKKALIGSLVVEAVVIASVAAGGKALVPSAAAALNGGPVAILGTYLARSALVAGGLYAAGERKNAIRNGLAGCAAIELVVLAWAKRCKNGG
jgi:hypothetical protein